MLKIVGITYLLTAAAFVTGYLSSGRGGFFGPSFGGIALAVMAFPCIVLGGVFYIAFNIKQNRLLYIAGYLALTVGVAGGYYIKDNYINHYIAKRRTQQKLDKIKRQTDYINSVIEDDVREIYPDAQIYTEYPSPIQYAVQQAFVKLSGYKYENPPNFDDEIAKWKEIKQKIPTDFPYPIAILYYFENAENNFAVLFLGDFTLRYNNRSTLSEKTAEQLTQILKNHLGNYHTGFEIIYDYTFIVSIKNLTNVDEPAETKLWQNFVRENNINTEIVNISVRYHMNDSTSRRYDISDNRWD
ncbi:MAG: hypothetical protein FWF99_00250 [Desulfovibrionaceae bacterium]|nr:hypothetical protein [Desulfovibrionaceae bacterium]